MLIPKLQPPSSSPSPCTGAETLQDELLRLKACLQRTRECSEAYGHENSRIKMSGVLESGHKKCAINGLR